MSRPAPRRLADAMEELAGQLAPTSTLARVRGVWGGAVGAGVAAAATPSAERDGVLTVTCSSSVWTQELQLMAPELLVRLNAALGGEPLRALRCRTG